MNNCQSDILLKKEKSYSVLKRVNALPSMPVIALEVSEIINDPRSTAADLGRAISKDQGLTAKILTVANSPLYGIPRRVSTIDFAIIILGFDQIKNITIALTMMDSFKNLNKKNFDPKKYWGHSIFTAIAAKRISDDLGYHLSGEAFTAGLLHDLGIAVINKYFNSQYQEIYERACNSGNPLQEAELFTLGLTHEEIGRDLAEKWNLPPSLTGAILNHHLPSREENFQELASIIHIADYIAHKTEAGSFVWDSGFQLDIKTIDILKLGNETYLDNFINTYTDLFEKQIDFLKRD